MSMTKREIDEAIAEARRFISRAEAAIAVEATEKMQYLPNETAVGGYRYVKGYPDGVMPEDALVHMTKESGALKRASLDLTRTLADLRRS